MILFEKLLANVAKKPKFVHFEDPEVKRICIENWDKDGDRKLSIEEVAAVSLIGDVFKNNTKIKSFDELFYFKGSSLRGNMFGGCTNLQFVSVPYTTTALFNDNVSSYKRILLKGEWSRIPVAFIWGSEKKNLQSIILESNNPPEITNISGFFYGNHTNNFAKIYVPNNSVEKYREAAVWRDYKDFINPLSDYQE